MAKPEAEKPREQMTPYELNMEFRKFLDLIPDPVPGPSELAPKSDDFTPEEEYKLDRSTFHLPPDASPDLFNEVQRYVVGVGRMSSIRRERKNSPELATYSVDLLALLSHSPVTPSFQRVIVIKFQSVFSEGRPRENEDGRNIRVAIYKGLLNLMDMDNSESPGIFDPQKAEEMERKAYQQEAFVLAFVAGIGSLTLGSEGFNEMINDPEKQNPVFKHRLLPERNLAQTWRQEFIAKYGNTL